MSSQLTYNTETGFTAPDTADIREAVQADWIEAFKGEAGEPDLDVEDTTPAGQLIDAETAEIAAKNTQFLWLASQFNPKTASGRFQDALGNIYFLTRKIAEPTIVTCQLTGLQGTQIPYGAIVKNTDGYQLICNSPVTIGESGTAETTFRLTETGPIQIAAHSVTTIVTVIAGWDTIDNEAAGATGRDKETRNEFEGRRYNSVAANAHGTVAAIYAQVANLDGVLDCKVLENAGSEPIVSYGVTIPDHSIAVCVYGGEEEDIAEAIYLKKDAGCGTAGNTEVSFFFEDSVQYTYKINRPDPINFYVKVVMPNADILTDTVKAAIAQAIVDDFLGKWDRYGNTRIGMAATVYASRFYPVVMDVDGVTQLTTVELKLGEEGEWGSKLSILATQEPTMTTENVTIVAE